MICVAANLAAKWLLEEVYSGQAQALLTACMEARRRIVAPPFLPIEITNIIRQQMVRREIVLTEAQELFRLFLAFPVTLSAPLDLYEHALAIAEEFRLPAVYAALAQLLGCDLWTDDRRLLRTLDGKLPFVRWIGDYRGNEGE